MKTLTLSILLFIFAFADAQVIESPDKMDSFIKSFDMTAFELTQTFVMSVDDEPEFNVFVFNFKLTTFISDLFIYYDYHTGKIVKFYSVKDESTMLAWSRVDLKWTDHQTGILKMNYIDFLQSFYPLKS